MRRGASEELQWELRHGKVSQPERGQLERELNIQKATEGALRDLQHAKALVLYGISAWILRDYDLSRLNAEEGGDWYRSCLPSGNIEATWSLNLKAIVRTTGRDYGRESWEMEESLDRGAVSLNFENYLHLLCCIRCLDLVKGMTVGQSETVSLPPTAEVIYLAKSEQSPFSRVLKQIETNAKSGNQSWEAKASRRFRPSERYWSVQSRPKRR
jgi:hypothetical protein